MISMYGWKRILAFLSKFFHVMFVRGPFSVAQPCVVRWRDDLTRSGFFLGSCVRNSTLGHVVQQLSAFFFKPIKDRKSVV